MVIQIPTLLYSICHVNELAILVHASFPIVTDCPKINKVEEQVAASFRFISYTLKSSCSFKILLAYISPDFSPITVLLVNMLAGSTSLLSTSADSSTLFYVKNLKFLWTT